MQDEQPVEVVFTVSGYAVDPKALKREVLQEIETEAIGSVVVRLCCESTREGVPWETKSWPPIPPDVKEVLKLVATSGIAAALYKLLKLWIENRNGRRLKIKVGDIEVEATQMKEEDVLRIFELLEEKADRKKIRELLLDANKGEGRPEAH